MQTIIQYILLVLIFLFIKITQQQLDLKEIKIRNTPRNNELQEFQ